MRYILILSAVVLPVFQAQARARFAPKAEMIQKADGIAIVLISTVSKTETQGTHWTYRQKASATVEQVLKGKLPKDIVLHGDENFICAQVHFAPGRYLVFLRQDGKLWTGANWQLSIRPITADAVEWYADDRGIGLKPAPLKDVLDEIQKILTEPKKNAPNHALD